MQEKSNLLTLVLLSVITAVVVGGIFYFWQENNLEMEMESPNATVLNYTDLSVCGDFTDYGIATDAGFYTVARSAENGDCLFTLNYPESRTDGECAYEGDHLIHPNRDCIEYVTKYYNLQGEEIEAVEIAAQKPILPSEFDKAIGR